jgi:phosphate transport system permease protein
VTVSPPALSVGRRFTRRGIADRIFATVCLLATLTGVVLLAILLWAVAKQGLEWVNLRFLSGLPSRFPEQAGILPALCGSVWIMALTAMFSLPVGVAAAVYLEEYPKRGRLSAFVEVNIANLAGVPSIVYGILGAAVFVHTLALGQSLWAGSLTMALLIMPTIIIAAREAVRAVPQSIRLAALGIGATRWQTVRSHVLPSALPGILTGVILALSRAIGETAPLIMVGALGFVPFLPHSPSDSYTVLPIQIYDWAARPQKGFFGVSGAAIIVLLAVLLTMNAAAVYIRQRFQRFRL